MRDAQAEESVASTVNRVDLVHDWLASRVRSRLDTSIALFVFYLCAGELSYFFVIPPSPNAIFWIPSGFTFALFVRTAANPGFWPGWLVALFLGELLLVLYHGDPYATALLWAASNVVLALASGLLARHFLSKSISTTRLRDTITMIGMIALSAVLPAPIAALGSEVGLGRPFLSSALYWGSSDAIGMVLVAPILLAITAPEPKPAGSRLEALMLLSTMSVAAALAFLRTNPLPIDRSLPFLLFFFVSWAAVRFGPRLTALAALLLDSVMVAATAKGMGPFVTLDEPPGVQLLNLQIMVSAGALVNLVLSSAIAEQREARKSSEQAVRARDDFLSVASHELNTPLATLRLALEGLALEKDLSQEESRFLAVLQRQYTRLALLVDQLVDSTRIREGRLRLTVERTDLCAVVREVREQFKDLAAESGSAISIPENMSVWGYWDRMRLEQILGSLLSNAIKFGDGQPIEVTVGQESENSVRLTVTDHGVGIPTGELEHIFERFAQAVDRRHYGGLGIGLSTVRSLLDLMGGSITVASRIGEGSTFAIQLPIGPPSTSGFC